MRGGRFLAEESPDHLLQRYACESLEDVFLKLAVRQNRGKRRRSSIAQEVAPSNVVSEPANANGWWWWLVSLLTTLSPPVAQNPALDLTNDDEPGEISGEFGDNTSLGGRAGDAPASPGDLAPAPLPELADVRPRTARERLSIIQAHHVKALIWKNFLWMWRNPA